MERPAISFLAVRLRNFVLRSVMEPRSLRAGWSLGSKSSRRVEAEELRESEEFGKAQVLMEECSSSCCLPCCHATGPLESLCGLLPVWGSPCRSRELGPELSPEVEELSSYSESLW